MQTTASPDLVARLNDLFTRSYYSAAGYVFESQPFTVDGDQEILTSLRDVRRQERSHARMLAQIVESLGRVPEPGAFPYWHRDLNYLTVPYITGFVTEALRDDVARYEAALEAVPQSMGLARTMLQSIRVEKLAALEELEPLVQQARAREAQTYADEIAVVRQTRAARLAKEKAAKEAARKAKSGASAAVAGMPDPDEPGISNREKGKRAVMRMRALKSGAAAGGAPAADPAANMPDPDEPGISNKEKAKRTMMIKRARAKGAAAAPAAADPAANMPDPNEPGISNKEKAKRTMMIKRARAKGAAAAPAAAAADPAASMPDPDEPGISNKEKAKRTMMVKRARAK